MKIKLRELPFPLKLLCFPVLLIDLALAVGLVKLEELRKANRGERKK